MLHPGRCVVTDDSIYFSNGVLSHWYPRPFVVEEDNGFGIGGLREMARVWTCVFQFVMASKAMFFQDTAAFDKIVVAGIPEAYEQIGAKIDTGDYERTWQTVVLPTSLSIGLRIQYGQHNDMREYLLSTGDKTLVAGFYHEKILGVGLASYDPNIRDHTKWTGDNVLGNALMKTRQYFRSMQ